MCSLARVRFWSEERQRRVLATETYFAQGNENMLVKMSWSGHTSFLFELSKTVRIVVETAKA